MTPEKFKVGDLVIQRGLNFKHIFIIDKVNKKDILGKNFYTPNYKFHVSLSEIRHATEKEIAFCVALKLKG